MAGFIYIMSNSAFPNLLKIGKSTKDPTKDRVSELNQTGVPEPFKVEYYALVEDETYNDHLNLINAIDASYCLVASSDMNISYNSQVPHVRHRNYSKDMLLKGWELIVSRRIQDCPDNREIKLFKKSKNQSKYNYN